MSCDNNNTYSELTLLSVPKLRRAFTMVTKQMIKGLEENTWAKIP